MSEHAAGPIEKFCSIRASRRGLGAIAAATLAARHGWEARAQDSTPVVYAGETFDAEGATLRVASWGGFWQETERKYLFDQFQEDFNCTVQYTSAWPWFPKFVERRG
jgi:spermidine/putrescine-binding protein